VAGDEPSSVFASSRVLALVALALTPGVLVTATVLGVRHRLGAWCEPGYAGAVLVAWLAAGVCLLVAPVYAWFLLTRAGDCIGGGAVPCGLGSRLVVGTYLGGLLLVGVGTAFLVVGRHAVSGDPQRPS
jgi:hypothetical protein